MLFDANNVCALQLESLYMLIDVYNFYDILCLVVIMRIIFIFLFVCSLFLLSSCQTIENKSQQAIKKENKKLSKFLQQPESELKIVMGEPDEITNDDKGSKLFIYISKKYNITCKREFEINENKMVVAFSHKGCF